MKRSPIRRVSAKKAKADRLYARNRKARAELADNLCELGSPACFPGDHLGDQAHHRLMRSTRVDHSVDNLLWVCSPGHTWVHAHPRLSYEKGWLIRGR